LLTGDLGAGKTCLTQGIASGLGIEEAVTSPTFNIMLEHRGRLPLYHFDLYRLEESEELEDIDYFATLEADGVSVVEWGDRFADATPADGIVVRISIDTDRDRSLQVTGLGPRGERLAREWVAACSASPGPSSRGEG
jgi:tRNA threonylcarbamoyladenosine biosynthesis protein TsaE